MSDREKGEVSPGRGCSVKDFKVVLSMEFFLMAVGCRIAFVLS